ncbi:MAG: diguanylate cyclase [Candidatus Sulfobium sp.]
MKHKLIILHLEDNKDDSELVRRELLRESLECDLVRVETQEDFAAALEKGGFDLIVADYALYSFDGLSALYMAKQKCPGLPFIFLSGAIGEEFAIETIKKGATDYVLKNSLSRLPVAIRRALLELEEHTKLRQAEEELEKYRKHLENMVKERTNELNKSKERLQLELANRRKLEEKLRTASMTDELTGLLNRRGFLIFAHKQCEIAKRNKTNFAILYLDLDEMKRINDEFGHREGDQALVDISTMLKKSFRASDIIARIGGDEFAVLITDPGTFRLEKAVAGHIGDNLKIHNEQTKKGYKLSVSMGMVHYNAEQPCPLEDLLVRADELMYAHKQQRGLERETIPSEKGGKKQDRLWERYESDVSLRAEILVSGSAVIKNISVSGIALRTSQRLTRNTIYIIRIRTSGGEELSCQAQVIWSSLVGKVSKKYGGLYYEAGLRFVEANKQFIGSLENLIYSTSTPFCLWEHMEGSDGWTSTSSS